MDFRMQQRKSILHLVGLVILAGLAGCTQLELNPDHPKFPWQNDDEPKVPARMTEVWTDAVLQQQGKPGVRGFGGRILFFTAANDEPVRVDGTLTVFVFDEVNQNPRNPVPERKFVFRREDLAKHYSKSELGHSYSVWLPWDEVGGPQRRLSLVTRFEPADGPVVLAKPSPHILPGQVDEPRQAIVQQKTLPARGPVRVGGDARPHRPWPGGESDCR